MPSNRRIFLKDMGVIASAVTVPQIALAAPEQTREETTAAYPKEVVANTNYGQIKGYLRNQTYTFKGVPYGAPTGGANRFLPPKEPEHWTGIRNCLVYGPICPQKANSGWLQQEYGFLFQWIDGFQDEDCLRLNVWTPAIADGRKRPVMFWIHGGGFFSGSSQEHPSYDGENLSHLGDVVLVSVNHRLNIFGYLDLSEYGSQYSTSANVGMLDLVAALEWVRDNIHNFGGDKDNVTIFGQSGGSSKVTTLMAMPAAKGLFHKAIAQSGSIVQVATPEYTRKITAEVLKFLDIDAANIALLHEIKPARLLEAVQVAERNLGSLVPPGVGRSGLQPVVDGKLLPTQPFDPVAPGISAHIPFMVGTTRNESSASIDNPDLENLNEEELRKRLQARFGEQGDLVYKAMRKVHPEVKPVEILSYVSAQNCMAYLQAQRKSDQVAPVYLYMFSWQTPVLGGRPRAFHCSEIPFVFNNTDRVENYTGASSEARQLSRQMAAAWIRFARFGNPNHEDLPSWPAFTRSNGAMMMFDKHCQVRRDPDGESRLLMQKVFYSKDL